MENLGFFSRLAERREKRAKARKLSVGGCLKTDTMGPNGHRVNVGWENQINYRAYWAKSQQPVSTWDLKVNAKA